MGQHHAFRLARAAGGVEDRHHVVVDDPEIATRIAQYELAFQMQTSVPETLQLEREPEHIRKMYGLDQEHTKAFGQQCLVARRMAERGVRFINIYNEGWDAHSNVEGNVRNNCKNTDQASAALIKDLKQRGLLDSTLVVWGGEFGRTPIVQGANGRDHNPQGFTILRIASSQSAPVAV